MLAQEAGSSNSQTDGIVLTAVSLIPAVTAGIKDNGPLRCMAAVAELPIERADKTYDVGVTETLSNQKLSPGRAEEANTKFRRAFDTVVANPVVVNVYANICQDAVMFTV
jgi:hypothetical protein